MFWGFVGLSVCFIGLSCLFVVLYVMASEFKH